MSGFFDSAFKGLGYMLSLPERTIRSLASLAGGTTSLLTDALFPEMLRGTTLYKIFVGDAQRFVIEKIAQIESLEKNPDEQAAGDDYLQRKMVGGALETAGLFAMHFSPLWVFAIAGDAAAGGNVFLERLTNQLKKNGVIPAETQITGLTDLLETIQDTTRRSAAAIDTPPLSREEIGKLGDDMIMSYSKMFVGATNLVPRFDDLWKRMETIADRQNVSIGRLSGILTMDVAAWGKRGIGAVLAVGQTGNDLLGEKILDSYANTLDAVVEEGFTGYIGKRMTPFFQAATGHFTPQRKSWTERLFGFGANEQVDPGVCVDPGESGGPDENAALRATEEHAEIKAEIRTEIKAEITTGGLKSPDGSVEAAARIGEPDAPPATSQPEVPPSDVLKRKSPVDVDDET